MSSQPTRSLFLDSHKDIITRHRSPIAKMSSRSAAIPTGTVQAACERWDGVRSAGRTHVACCTSHGQKKDERQLNLMGRGHEELRTVTARSEPFVSQRQDKEIKKSVPMIKKTIAMMLADACQILVAGHEKCIIWQVLTALKAPSSWNGGSSQWRFSTVVVHTTGTQLAC